MTTRRKLEKKNAKLNSRRKTSSRKNTSKTLSSRSRKIFRQCLSCGGIVDQMYSTGDVSWCPHCFDFGAIDEKIGELPEPQLYGSWLLSQKEAEKEKQQNPREDSAATLNFGGGATLKTRKKHSGVYSCPECCIEFDLFMHEELKCDECGGPLVSGSLEDQWEDEEELND